MVIKQVIPEVKQNHNIKQECIPVGCTLTAAVATSRCQYQEGWVDPPFQMESPSRCRHPSDADPPFRCKPQLQMQTPASDVDPTSDADLPSDVDTLQIHTPFRCRHPSDPYTLQIQTPFRCRPQLQMQTSF